MQTFNFRKHLILTVVLFFNVSHAISIPVGDTISYHHYKGVKTRYTFNHFEAAIIKFRITSSTLANKEAKVKSNSSKTFSTWTHFTDHNLHEDPWVEITTSDSNEIFTFTSESSPIYQELEVNNIDNPHTLNFGDTTDLISLMELDSIVFDLNFNKKSGFLFSLHSRFNDTVLSDSYWAYNHTEIYKSDSLVYSTENNTGFFYNLDSGNYKLIFKLTNAYARFLNLRATITEYAPLEIKNELFAVINDSTLLQLDSNNYTEARSTFIFPGDTIKQYFPQLRGHKLDSTFLFDDFVYDRSYWLKEDSLGTYFKSYWDYNSDGYLTKAYYSKLDSFQINIKNNPYVEINQNSGTYYLNEKFAATLTINDGFEITGIILNGDTLQASTSLNIDSINQNYDIEVLTYDHTLQVFSSNLINISDNKTVSIYNLEGKLLLHGSFRKIKNYISVTNNQIHILVYDNIKILIRK